MSDDEKAARTFNNDQQGMFGEEEANQAGSPVRPREPDVPAPLDVSFEPPPRREPTDPADEPRLHVVAKRGEGGADITGGTDKYGSGGLADSENPESGATGARETGDIVGASSTHAGAGGDTEQTGGVGTAPNTVGGLGQE